LRHLFAWGGAFSLVPFHQPDLQAFCLASSRCFLKGSVGSSGPGNLFSKGAVSKEEAERFWSIFPPKQEEQKIVAFQHALPA
jgi:hypothetical protein